MRGPRFPLKKALVIFALVTMLALVMSLSSLTMRSEAGPALSNNPQEITPTPEAADRSVPGSTDGIMWMGVAIAAIVLLPLLAQRTLWRSGSS